MGPTEAEASEFCKELRTAAELGGLPTSGNGLKLYNGPRNAKMSAKMIALLERYRPEALAAFKNVKAKRRHVDQMLARLIDRDGKLYHNNRQELVLLTT